jgi:hypothetical protein
VNDDGGELEEGHHNEDQILVDQKLFNNRRDHPAKVLLAQIFRIRMRKYALIGGLVCFMVHQP